MRLPAFLIIAALFGMTAHGETWTVDDDGKADFSSIQAAIDAAADGDEVIVYPGTYLGTGDDVVDTMGKAIWLHSSDGPKATFIDGENVRRGIVCQSGEAIETVIEGFTIRNCQATWFDWNGDGQASYWEYFGGGMWNRDGSSPLVHDCRFVDNVAEYGGGVCNGYGEWLSSNPTLSQCVFQGNSAGSGVGGGVYNWGSSPSLLTCTFIDNTAGYGGAILNWAGSNPSITECDFENNSASLDGGAIYTDTSEPTLTSCTFTGNSAAHDGGAIFNADPSTSSNVPIIDQCTFLENVASDEGGAIHNVSISPVLTECVLQQNAAGEGGGIYSWNGSDPSLATTELCGNTPDQIVGPWEDKGGNTVEDSCATGPCPADVTLDGIVDISDILAMISAWGPCDGCIEDINGDGVVDVTEILAVMAAWGPCS